MTEIIGGAGDHDTLVVGAFYWAMPVHDPDRELDWEYYCQPVRFFGRDAGGNPLWQCIGMEEPTIWGMRWIGPRIISPMDDEEARMAVGNDAPKWE